MGQQPFLYLVVISSRLCQLVKTVNFPRRVGRSPIQEPPARSEGSVHYSLTPDLSRSVLDSSQITPPGRLMALTSATGTDYSSSKPSQQLTDPVHSANEINPEQITSLTVRPTGIRRKSIIMKFPWDNLYDENFQSGEKTYR